MDGNGKKMLVVPSDFLHVLHPKLLMLESWNKNENEIAVFLSFKSFCLCPMDTQVLPISYWKKEIPIEAY